MTMKCERAQTQVMAYLSGALDASSAARLMEHIGQCPTCRAELDCLREVTNTLSGLGVRPMPESAANRVRERLAENRSRPRKPFFSGIGRCALAG